MEAQQPKGLERREDVILQLEPGEPRDYLEEPNDHQEAFEDEGRRRGVRA